MGNAWPNSSPPPWADLGRGEGLLGSNEPPFADLLVLIVTSSMFDTQSLLFDYRIPKLCPITRINIACYPSLVKINYL